MVEQKKGTVVILRLIIG